VAPALPGLDVALFDRYVHTHLAAATGRLHHEAWTRALLSICPRPDRVYLLDLPAEDALERIGSRDERTIDENAFMLDRYRRRLAALAEREGFVVLDARRSYAENQAAMRSDLDALLAESAR
jgi:dTMP kinase